MEEYLAWMSAQKPQKKWEALRDESEQRNVRHCEFVKIMCGRMSVRHHICPHQSKLVDLYVERLQLLWADLL